MTGYTHPRALAAGDDITAFDCGEPSLDEYLRKRALTNHLEGASRCIVTTHGGHVVGYYALASAAIYHRELRGRVRRNMPDPMPGVLLSRLAVDRKHQGSGIGRQLLRDAILRTIEAANLIGVRVLLVHALNDEAREFYARQGFEPSPSDPLHLMLLIKDAQASLNAT
jgi:GNAT superfamily N-acetyltransferase